MEWEIEDVGIHAHIKVKGTEDDMIGIGLPLKLAENIVNRHNAAIKQVIAEGRLSTETTFSMKENIKQ